MAEGLGVDIQEAKQSKGRPPIWLEPLLNVAKYAKD